MQRLLDAVARAIGAEWIDIAEWLRDRNSIDAIEAKLLVHDFAGVVQEVEAAAQKFAAETHGQWIRAGQAGAKWLDGELDDRLVRFDVTNAQAVAAAQRNRLELVQGLTAETRQNMQAAIIDGQRAGLNPRSIARDIRDGLGLATNQERAVRSYRAALQSGDWSNALGRELSSGQSDRSIRRAARDGGSLTEAQVEAAVERYRQNQITWRAEMIARTESAKNVHAGLDEAFRQAVERGDVEAAQLIKEWIHGPVRLHSRDWHVDMDGKQVAYGELFVLPDGARMKYPHDPAGGAKNVIGCTCTFATTLAA